MKRFAVALAHALLGWVLCSATMGAALALTSEATALMIHLVAVPFLALTITALYYRRPSPIGPIAWATLLLGTIASFDAIVVAWLILHSFEMFLSPLGIWIPFAVLFLTAATAGWVCRAAPRRSCLAA